MRRRLSALALLILGGAGAFWLTRVGEGAEHVVRLVDAVTGTPIQGGKACLLREDRLLDGNVDAPATWKGKEARAGDQVLAAASGYDLGSAVLVGSGVTVIRLAPARGRAEIRRTGDSDAPEVVLTVRHLLRRAAVYDSLLWFDETYTLRGDAKTVPLPAGLSHMTFETAKRRDFVTVPSAVLLHDGDRRDFRVEPTRHVVVHWLDAPSHDQLHGFALLDVRGLRALPAEDVDAYRGLGMGGTESGAPDSVTLGPVPRVPLLLYLQLGGRWLVRTVDASTTRLDVRAVDLEPMESPKVRIGGSDAPAGTLVLPGVVPEGAFSLVLAQYPSDPRLLGRTDSQGVASGAWWRINLASAWHPDHGLAVLGAAAGNTLLGEWEPGSIEIEAGDGQALRGTISTRSGWVGSDLVSFAEVEDQVRRNVLGAPPYRLAGLALGRLLLNYDLALTAPDGHPIKVAGSVHVRLTPSEPNLALRVVDGVLTPRKP